MKKAWLTSITVASIAGSAGAAFAGVNAIHSASAESAPASSETPDAATLRTISYQIGSAGVVTLTTDGTTITVTESIAGDTWSLVGASPAGAHVEVQFTDGQQLVTFLADQVGDDVAVSLTNVEAPGATTTTAPVPMEITVISQAPAQQHPEHDAPDTHPAPTPPPTTAGNGGTGVTPPPATTTKPSPKHDDDDEEDEGEDD